jgi:endo-1,3(4)-beta-glucanase
LGFSAPRAPVATHLAAVRAALIADASFIPDPGTVSNDSYFGGKQLAKLARLALIADELGETAIAATLRARLTPPVAAWLDGTNGNPFRYDSTWGGLVTVQSLASAGASFGSGHYNDHHFHYGYILYAAAALAKASPGFAAAHRAGLLAIVRDIANPSLADPRFPRFRHLDFFRAHSWAGGLQDNPDGQDQESSSEAANAWYAIHLLGLSTGDRRLSDLGRVMLALELDAARTYYQVPAASTIYPAAFAQNGCVGRLYETRVTFDTFFGTEPWKVFGIQMLPFTPITEELISPAWVSDRWPAMQSAAATVPPDWVGFRGFLYMAHATSARELAWTEATGLTGWDDGNSNANTLWWVATRP